MRLLAVLVLLASGCAPADPDPALEPPPVPDPTPLTVAGVPSFDLGSGAGTRSGRRLDLDDPVARRAFHEDSRAAFGVRREISAAMAGTADWRQAEAAAERLLPRVPEFFQASVEGDVSLQIVQRLLRLPSLDAEATDALSHHTRTLVRLETTEADDVLRALIRLDGVWDDGLRARTARTAAERLGGVFAAKAGCVGCTVEQALDGMWPATRDSMDPLLYDIQTVHRGLMEIARGGAPMP